MIRADQIFIKCSSRERVACALDQVLAAEGFERVSEPMMPSTYMSTEEKDVRSFYVADAIGTWVCVLEALGGDEDLAADLSRLLSSAVVWISYSEIVEILEYSRFECGTRLEQQIIRPGVPTTREVIAFQGIRKSLPGERELIGKAQEIYTSNGLPWPFYSFEQINLSPNKDDYFVRLNFRRRR